MLTGQGCPADQLTTPCHVRVNAACGAFHFTLKLSLVLVLALVAASRGYAQRVECELRFVWDSNAPIALETKLRLGEGFIRPVRNLSVSPQSIGAVEATSARELLIHGNATTGFGGLDFHITASLDTVLFIEVTDSANRERKFEHRIQVRDILQQTWIEPVDELGVRVALERQVGDKLRVESGSETNIFSPGESCPLTVSGYQTGLPAGTYEIEFLFDGESHHSIEVGLDETGSFSPKHVDLVVPQRHGGHLLEMRLYRWSAFPSLLSKTPALVRRYDIAVFSGQSAARAIRSWRELASIDAFRASQTGTLSWLAPEEITRFIPTAASELATRIAPYNPLAGTLTRPDKYGQLRQRELLVDGQRRDCLVIGPQSWLAIPVQGLTVGTPHRLRVYYPDDLPMQLTASVRRSLQGNGASSGPSFDTEVELKYRQCKQSPSGLVHELIFWPTDDSQEVLLLNGSAQFDASVLRVEIAAAETKPLAEAAGSAGNRSVAIAFDTAYLPDVFAVDRAKDPAINRQHETWSTWSEVSKRITDVAQIVGATSVHFPAVAEGAALHPSNVVAPTSALQSSAFFTDSRSPDLKDATELLLKHFDASGQSAYVGMDFTGRLPGIETKIRKTGSDRLTQKYAFATKGLGAEQTTQQSAESAGQQYNPLSSDVQQELKRAIEEVVRRYQDHPSFAGVELRLTPKSHFVFRDATWGYDEQSLLAFQSAAGGTLDTKRPVAELFTQVALRRSYLQWRAAELTRWLDKLAKDIQDQFPGTELIVRLDGIAGPNQNNGRAASPSLSAETSAAEQMLAHGVLASQLLESKHLTIAGSSKQIPVRDSHGSEAPGYDGPGVDTSAGGASSIKNCLVVKHSTRLRRIEKADGDAPDQRIFPVVHGPGRYNLRPIIEQLYQCDAQQIILEGWSPKIGDAPTLAEFSRTFSRLPLIPMTDVELNRESGGIKIRSGRTSDATYVQIINNAPWSEELSLRFDCEAGTRVELFGGSQDTTLTLKRNAAETFAMRAFDLRVIRINDPTARIADAVHRTATEELVRLDAELSALQSIIARSGDPSHYNELTSLGGDFESWQDTGAPAGWAVSSLPQASIGPSERFPRAGQRCALITNAGSGATSAWMQSREFAPPKTNRMLVSAWLRSSPSSPPLRARISVSGRKADGSLYSQSTEVGGNSAAGGRIPIDWGRRPVQLFVDDVPSAELQSLFVAIELIGQGKLWVDDVQVFEMILQPNEQNHLRGQLLLAKNRLAEGDAFVAEQLLSGPWGDYLAKHAELFGSATGSRNGRSPADQKTADGSSWNNPEPILQRWRSAFEQRLRR